MTIQFDNPHPMPVISDRPSLFDRFSLQSVAGRLHGHTRLFSSSARDGFSAPSKTVTRLMDDVLMAAFEPEGLMVAPGRLEVDQIAPMPFNVRIAVTTWVTLREGRHVFAAATLHAGGCLLTQAQGGYVITSDGVPETPTVLCRTAFGKHG